jgi:SAM-dependent methyltransferase
LKLTTDKRSDGEMTCACCGAPAPTSWMNSSQLTGNGKEYRLVRCSYCSHIWISNPPAPREMSQYYGPAYHRGISSSGEGDAVRWGRQLKVISQYKTHGSVLDIGCSSGGFLTHLEPGSWELSGIEANPEMAERARRATKGRIFAGDVVDADFAPDSFDLITCTDVLEHLYEPRLVFDKVRRWLRPGGIFYVFVPNIMSWEARAFGPWWYGLDLPRHLHHYSAQSLAALAASADLQPLRIVTPAGCYLEQSLSIWLTSLFHKAGAENFQVSLNGPGPLPWRLLRKGIRLTVEAAYANVAASRGAGPSLQVVLQRPPASGSPSGPSTRAGKLAEEEVALREFEGATCSNIA